jgi:hypothetical protein
MPTTSPALDRFWAKVDKTTGGCWLWTGALNPKGYGRFNGGVDLLNRNYYAHRFSYEVVIGLIPDGLTIDHLCRVRHCVNPEHLQAVPHRVNLLRGDTVIAANAAKSTCPDGHAHDLLDSRGSRVCSICQRARYDRRNAQRRKAA